MSWEPIDDLKLSYPRDYDPYKPPHIGIEIPDAERDTIEDEP